MGRGADSGEDVLIKKTEISAARMSREKVTEPFFFLWCVFRLWDLVCS